MTSRETLLPYPRCSRQFADGRRCALPAHPACHGLCYPHGHAPHRRLRPSDLTRELTSSPAPLPEIRIRRLLAKLPLALADGTIDVSQARDLRNLCSLLIQSARLCANHPLSNDPLPSAFPSDSGYAFVSSLLNNDGDEDDADHGDDPDDEAHPTP